LQFRTEEIILPIIIKSNVAGEGASVGMNLDAEWDALHDLMLTQERVAFIFGTKTLTVTVDSIATEPTNATSGMIDWNVNYEWPEGVWLVRLLTQEA
jgi:hypothetical protein